MALRVVIFISLIHTIFAQSYSCTDSSPCTADTLVTANGHITCSGYHSCEHKIIRQTGSGGYDLTLSGELSGQDADILTDTLTASGEQAALGATIVARVVTASGAKSAQNAIITFNTAYSGTFDINLNGENAGYNAQITCSSGQTCDIHCADSACEETKFYCYSGATSCHYDCDSNGICPELIGGVESSLTDPQIHEIYLRNIEKLAKPDSKFNYPSDSYKYILSLTSSQFMIFVTVIALTILLSIGLCLWNLSTFKNNREILGREDWINQSK